MPIIKRTRGGKVIPDCIGRTIIPNFQLYLSDQVILVTIYLLREYVLKNNSGANAKELAKDVLKEVLNPQKETARLTKQEEIELMAKNFNDTRKLKLLKKQAKG